MWSKFAILDVETTGLDPKTARITELGLLFFTRFEDGTLSITSLFGSLQNPGVPIPAEITKLTGLTDEICASHAIDWHDVRAKLDAVDAIIAHNARFDKSFILALPEMEGLDRPWLCSRSGIPWKSLGFKTEALNYLAADHGFVNPFAHRALFDCATTFRLIESHLGTLIDNATQRKFEVRAVGAAFEMKDALREAGYHWNKDEKVWMKTVLEGVLELEREWLTSNVYGGRAKNGTSINEITDK